MRLLLDAQLPRRLASLLSDSGHDVIHTLELPNGNRTPDSEIIRIADEQGRTVVTKDSDFVQSHILLERPARIFLISTGNISNAELIALLLAHLPAIVQAFDGSDFVELSRTALIVH